MRKTSNSAYTDANSETLRGSSVTGYNSKTLSSFKGQSHDDFTWIAIGY